MKVVLFFLLSMISFIMVSCSETSSTTLESESVYTEITFSGRINESSSAKSGARFSGSETNYMVVIQNQISKRTYLTQIQADGTFSFDSNSDDATAIQAIDHEGGYGNHFMLMLVQKEPLEVKAVAYLPDSASEGYSGFQFSESLSEELVFSYDEDTSSMTISEDLVQSISGLSVDEDFMVRLEDGSPVGATNFGKADEAMVTEVNDLNLLDPDQDGQPNIFDGMNDGMTLDNLVAENFFCHFFSIT